MFQNKKILFVGCHPDDIEFGCGGVMAQLDTKFCKVVVFCVTLERNGEKILSELDNSMKSYNMGYHIYKDIQTGCFFKSEDVIKQRLYELKQEYKPDIIFSTSPTSVNSDHCILAKCVLNVFQEQSILFYEIVRGDYIIRPDVYITLSSDDVDKKIRALGFYETQYKRHYSRPEVIQAKLQSRGAEINTEYAEVFQLGRIVIKNGVVS